MGKKYTTVNNGTRYKSNRTVYRTYHLAEDELDGTFRIVQRTKAQGLPPIFTILEDRISNKKEALKRIEFLNEYSY